MKDGDTVIYEKDLEVYDIWESPNGNAFIKMTHGYSVAIGPRGDHAPSESDLKNTQFVKANEVTPVKKIGKITWNS